VILGHRQGMLIILLTFIVSLIITLIPLPDMLRPFRPPWYTLVLIYWAMAHPERIGVGSGWMLGLIVDVMTGSLLGQHALTLSLIAYIVVKLHAQIRVFPMWQQSVAVMILLFLEPLIATWAMGISHQPPPPILYWTTPVIGMLLWPWIFIILRNSRRRYQIS
jgi:rod shape-determining protein MreD